MGRTVCNFALLLVALTLVMMAGCATKDSASKAPVPGSGIAEYRQIADDALQTLDGALQALAGVQAQTNRCPPRVLKSFSEAVERLDVNSIRIRARSQAMQARGEAYFQQWHENLARMKDPEVRKLAEQHRTELEKSFANIKQYSHQARATFQPFLSGLRQLRVKLENDPATVQAESTRAIMQNLGASGQRVRQAIVSVKEELNNAKRLITPGATAKAAQ